MNDSNNNPKDNPLDVQFAPQSDVVAAPEVKETLTPDMTDNSPAEKPSPEKKPTRGEKKIAKMEKKLADEKAEEERRRMAKLYPGSKNYQKKPKKKKGKKLLIAALVLVLVAAVGVSAFMFFFPREFTWKFEDGTLYISGWCKMPDYKDGEQPWAKH
ncbi:MAG: hypothetical protein IKM46_08520, partial [Clostridia bacterium]|nr:hypothetical protein [Clostridia bacterium]